MPRLRRVRSSSSESSAADTSQTLSQSGARTDHETSASKQQHRNRVLPMHSAFLQRQLDDQVEILNLLRPFRDEDTIEVHTHRIELHPNPLGPAVHAETQTDEFGELFHIPGFDVITQISCVCCGGLGVGPYVFWTLQSAASSPGCSSVFDGVSTLGPRPSQFQDILGAVRDHCSTSRHHTQLGIFFSEPGLPRRRQFVPVPATTKNTFSHRIPLVGDVGDAKLIFETVPRHMVNVNGYDFAVSGANFGSEAFETAEERNVRVNEIIGPQHSADEKVEQQLMMDGRQDGVEYQPSLRLFLPARVISSGQGPQRPRLRAERKGKCASKKKWELPRKSQEQDDGGDDDDDDDDHSDAGFKNDTSGRSNYNIGGRSTVPRTNRDLRIIITDSKQRSARFYQQYKRLVLYQKKLGVPLVQARDAAWKQVCKDVKETVVAVEDEEFDLGGNSRIVQNRYGMEVSPGDVFRSFLSAKRLKKLVTKK